MSNRFRDTIPILNPTKCKQAVVCTMLALLWLSATTPSYANGEAYGYSDGFENVDFSFAGRLGGMNYVNSRDIIVDAAGNTYTAGYFDTTGDFDPGVGTLNATSNGDTDIYVNKLDVSGNLLWNQQIGGTDADLAYSIVEDTLGNVYVTGSYQDTVDFDPGAGSSPLTSAGDSDIFIVKLSSAGSFVWAVSMGGTGFDEAISIDIDSSDQLHITGLYSGTADFDPGAGSSPLTSTAASDVFVCKVDSSGALLWAKSFPGNQAGAIAVDGAGNAYTVGSFIAAGDYDPGIGTSNLSPIGLSDIFVTKLDSAGDLEWAKSFGGFGNDFGYGIAVDGSANVLTTGQFSVSVDFDPGAGSSVLTASLTDDFFVNKWDTNGDFAWAKGFGEMNGGGVGRAITTDSDGNAYIVGELTGSVQFDFGPIANLFGGIPRDVFIARFEPDGNFVWAKGMSGEVFGYGIFVDDSKNVSLTGDFYKSTDFDPGPGSAVLLSPLNTDAFIVNFDFSPSPVMPLTSVPLLLILSALAMAGAVWEIRKNAIQSTSK